MTLIEETKKRGIDVSSVPTNNLLKISLAAAIPLWIRKLQDEPLESLLRRAPDLSQIIAEKGDIIMFRANKKGETAKAFNALAEGLAILSHLPGGVAFLGTHWETVRE